jgi:TolA-binding protein
MSKGDFETSLRLSEDVLKNFPRTLGDSALYQIGLIHLNPKNIMAEEQLAVEAFQKILESYPKSNRKEDASVWLFTLQEMAKKKQEVKEMTKVLKEAKLVLKRKDKRIVGLTANLKKETERVSQLEVIVKDLQKQINILKSQIKKLKSVDIVIEKQKRRSLNR